MDRLTPADLARMRAEHVEHICDGGCSLAFAGESACGHCAEDWPCDAGRLLAELDYREANPPRWQGHNHRSPVPHLAGVDYGLMGPSLEIELPTAEELAR